MNPKSLHKASRQGSKRRGLQDEQPRMAKKQKGATASAELGMRTNDPRPDAKKKERIKVVPRRNVTERDHLIRDGKSTGSGGCPVTDT